MADKMTCPGCEAHTSSVLRAFREGSRCPYCGLSAEAMGEITAVRESLANDLLKGRLEEALKRADKAEHELGHVRAKLDAVRAALDAGPDEG